jgi:type I restriction enzyme, S subunit
LLEGLEIKEINFNKTLQNKDFRIDSDFYTKEPKKNDTLKYDRLGNHLIKSQYGISIEMNEGNIGYPIYRMNEIHNMLCDLEVNKFADITNEEKYIFLLNDRDVIFNRTNSYEWVGRTGLYRKIDDREFVFASYLVKFIPNEATILPEYLTAFLNSKFGIWDVKRRSRQSINQTNVNPEEVKAIEIPLLNKIIQHGIKNCFDEAHLLRIKSIDLYKQAETLLLQVVGLQNFQPSTDKINVKSFKDSFVTTGRLDAEYYQKKYEDYLFLNQHYSNGCESLKIACNLIDSKFNPNEMEQYKYIELSDIGKTGDINSCTYALGNELPSRARRRVKIGDVIISSIEGSLESCALITKEYDDALCSTGFYVINSKSINSQTLLVLFKSELMQNILKQACSGTILTAINKFEFSNIPVPIIEFEIQKQIAELVEESFRLKKESEELLELAKRMVEVAVEEGEERAMELSKEKVM